MSLFGYNLRAVAGDEDRHHQATQPQTNGPLSSRTRRPTLLSNEKACLTHGSIEQLEDLATSDSPGLGWSTSLADANKGSRRVVVTRVHEKRDAAD